MEAKADVMQPQLRNAKGRQKLERWGKTIYGLQRDHGCANTLLQSPGLYIYDRIHFCRFKPPGLWWFVVAAVVNQYDAIVSLSVKNGLKYLNIALNTKHFLDHQDHSGHGVPLWNNETTDNRSFHWQNLVSSWIMMNKRFKKKAQKEIPLCFFRESSYVAPR